MNDLIFDAELLIKKITEKISKINNNIQFLAIFLGPSLLQKKLQRFRYNAGIPRSQQNSYTFSAKINFSLKLAFLEVFQKIESLVPLF